MFFFQIGIYLVFLSVLPLSSLASPLINSTERNSGPSSRLRQVRRANRRQSPDGFTLRNPGHLYRAFGSEAEFNGEIPPLYSYVNEGDFNPAGTLGYYFWDNIDEAEIWCETRIFKYSDHCYIAEFWWAPPPPSILPIKSFPAWTNPYTPVPQDWLDFVAHNYQSREVLSDYLSYGAIEGPVSVGFGGGKYGAEIDSYQYAIVKKWALYYLSRTEVWEYPKPA